ncbi:antitoxin [Dietzia sp. 179-F 9C3 NHS]|uniref:antitoxin n=1 Tax=Dietzia sp. 179-F 9C3 NHS TaxID=3374295 RepID=UPI00387A62F5
MGFLDKIKDFAGKNPDKVDTFTEKAGDAFDAKTGGKYARHTDTAQAKAGDYLKGTPGQQPPAGEQPPA